MPLSFRFFGVPFVFPREESPGASTVTPTITRRLFEIEQRRRRRGTLRGCARCCLQRAKFGFERCNSLSLSARRFGLRQEITVERQQVLAQDNGHLGELVAGEFLE